jgi:DNA-binding response OmpR family regulator
MASTKTILVVEDDASIRRGLTDALRFKGYEVQEAENGTKGMQLALEATCDLILLDVILPGPDGLQILDAVRKVRPTLPVIMLTAKGAESDRVQGLKQGADDYVVKPFSLKELTARVEAVLRRCPEQAERHKELKLPNGGVADLIRFEVRFPKGQRNELSQKETEILLLLSSNANRPVSREELLRRVWNMDPRNVETRTIDMHVARLREKLRVKEDEAEIILTVRGKGYMYQMEEA